MHGIKLEQFRPARNSPKPNFDAVRALLLRLSGSRMRPLKALLISDGRPGHHHLAEGILAAIARCRPVETTRIEIDRRRWMPGRFLAAFVNGGMSPSAVLRLGYGLKAGRLRGADIVVSAGGDTLAANAAAARLLGVPNIFYGSLRRFKPEDFALVLTSHACNGVRPRHVVTLKPSAVDPDTMARPASLAGGTGGSGPTIAGLLIGGNTATIRYSAQDWSQLIDFMRAFHASAGTRWIVSNSRRTPPEASDRLAALAAEPGSPVESFIDVRNAGSETLAGLFARSELVIATVDSSSMVSEAVWARRPVIAVAPASSRLSDHEQEYRDYLEASGWARSIAIADLKVERLLPALREIKPLDANPLDLLAATLGEKLPELFAPHAQ
jgi:mitochondrial fission protein ELM1